MKIKDKPYIYIMFRLVLYLMVLIFVSFDVICQSRVSEKELSFDKSSYIKVYYYKDTLFNGSVYTYYDSAGNDSSMGIKEEWAVSYGKREGLFKKFFKSGALEIKGIYKVGKKEGIWKKWFANGTLKYEGTFKNGQKDGVVKSWYSNGNLSYMDHFKNGKRHGLCKNYSKTGNGMILCDKEYLNGKMIKQKCYNYE